jgi:hypothetical protein
VTGKLVGAGLTPHEIYEQLTGGPGTNYLQAAKDATATEWGREDDRATLIKKLGEKIRMGWQGEASDAAFGASLPLAQAAMQGTDKLDTAQDLLSRQSGSFHDAFNSVRPVPPRPPDNNVLNESIPFETDLDREIKTYQADAQHNIDVFHGYDNASSYNETNMPKEYSTITHSGGTITVKPAGGDTGGDSGDPGDGRRDRVPGGSGPGSGEPGNPGGGAPGGSPVGGPLPGSAPVGGPGSGGQQTSPSDVRPGPGAGGFPQSPAASGQPGGGTAPPGGFFPGGGFPGGSGGPGGGTGGFGGRGGGGSTGGFGGRGGGAGGGGAGGPGARGAVPGAGPGAGAGALAAEEAAVRRGGLGAAGARGAGGMPMGGMGAGKGQGDEDEEHERKIMIESGGEDVFGSDVLTAPQVIGDDEYED